MLRGPSAPICSGASCWASVLRVCVVRVVAMRLSVEFFGVGACVQCVVGRVGAFVCVWVVGFPGIVCVVRLCGGMPPESLELKGFGFAWRAPFPRFARNCQGTWEVGRIVGAALGCRTPPSRCGRGRPGSSHWFSEFAQHMRACGGAMSSSGATVFCVHSMGMAVLGEGCSFPVNVGHVVSSAIPPSSGRSPLSRFPLRLVPSRPLVYAGVMAEECVLRRSN